MNDYTSITVDNHFIGHAITIALQMRNEIPDDTRIEIKDMEIDPDTGYLVLTVQRLEETIN